MAVEEKDAGAFEKALLTELKFGGLEQENLEELVKIAAGLFRAGLQRVKGFPRGIPPVVDGLEIKGVVDQAALASLIQRIVKETPRLKGVSVFPYGIPNTEIYQVAVSLGATVESMEREF
jgi:hypothetical protein